MIQFKAPFSLAKAALLRPMAAVKAAFPQFRAFLPLDPTGFTLKDGHLQHSGQKCNYVWLTRGRTQIHRDLPQTAKTPDPYGAVCGAGWPNVLLTAFPGPELCDSKGNMRFAAI
ncbi:hypothetical protein [Salaquimonas pukyongi]|uniref:hypothetical protein n=1 Tax=Salaquimonas pukyongi TaxID=2712698 RepID=UPI0012EB379C|nr:hypothetical protein [Salaquimonas pukyongi]